ncbi:MAG: hypothetical protein ABIP55_04395 [Tepidisphaeraceae bacterium]
MSHASRPAVRSVVLVFCCLLIVAGLTAAAMAVADRRFDVATFNCTPDGSADHFCEAQFDALNFGSANGHFLAMGTDGRRADVNAAGNFLAAYYNDLTGLYGTYTGTQAADQIENYIIANFTSTGVKPTWVIINEISAGQWPGNAAYRAWVRTCIARLKTTYGHSIILGAPFANPANNAADWVPLSQNCYIGIEKYLSGAAINASGNSVTWCKTQYQSSKTSYLNLGIAADRLYLFEHFAQTVAGTAWGRSGVSYAGWDNAINARADAAKQVGFAGFVGYAWGKNGMGVAEVDMVHFEQTYAAKPLP